MTPASPAPLPAQRFIALLQRGCSLKAAWMACGLPWGQWPVFRAAYRNGGPSPWAGLAQEAREAHGLALAFAWTELRQADTARWLTMCREQRRHSRPADTDPWFAPLPGTLGAAIADLTPLLDEHPELREKLIALVEKHSPPTLETPHASASPGS